MQPWVDWGPNGRLIGAAIGSFFLLIGLASITFARPLVEWSWSRADMWRRAMAIGGFEGSVVQTRIVGGLVFAVGVGFLVVVIHG